nr:hypothetical protein [Blastocatellia bacterium]
MKKHAPTRHFRTACLLPALLFLLAASLTRAGSATWLQTPVDSDWSSAVNWSPKTVPNGPSDVATFATSNVTGISLGTFDEVSSIVFAPGASSFTITNNFGTLTISGAGVINNSGTTQNFVAQSQQALGNNTLISFINQAGAGDATYSNYGAQFELPPLGMTEFRNNATAENATFFNHSGVSSGGYTLFVDASTAANAHFFNYPAEFLIEDYGHTKFLQTSSAGNATFTCYGGVVSGSFGPNLGGTVSFAAQATAANAVFTLEGGTATQTGGGRVTFSVNSTAANSTITVGAGSNGGLDAYVYFWLDSLGGEARIILSGTLDISDHNLPGVTTGSVEGAGTIILGRNNLSVGSAQLSTIFSGTVEDGSTAGGSLSVIGGQLALTNDNPYTGGTSVNGGTLLVDNRTGSATGTGAVVVESGTLAGRGTISGAVTIGGGSGVKAQLKPSAGTKKPARLTIQSSLTLKAGGIYSYRLKTRNSRADEVVADGVTIESGARFQLHAMGNQSLTVGQVLIAIDNTSNASISGNFSNLADGSTFTVGNNSFQVSYEGGDGNDLTLT